MSKKLVVGQGWSMMAEYIASGMSASHRAISIHQFSDEEVYINAQTLPESIFEEVVIIWQIIVNDDGVLGMNDQLFGLFLLIDALRQLGAQVIDLVIPYLPYSRQDYDVEKKYQGFIFALGACLKALGINRIVVCDLHAPAIQKKFDLPLIQINCDSLWKSVIAQECATMDRRDICIVSPDTGGWDRARLIAQSLGVAAIYIKKRRSFHDHAEAYELMGDVRGKVVIMVDDIIDTGRTALSACALLRSAGAQMMYGCFTHALFSDHTLRGAIQRAFVKIFVSNSVNNQWILRNESIEIVPIDELIVSVLNKIV